jgi:hypothetical protein
LVALDESDESYEKFKLSLEALKFLIADNELQIFFIFHHLSHLGEGLPQLAFIQAETPGR